jgi:hypothetical protein
LLDHNVCKPLFEVIDLDGEQFRRKIEVQGSLVNSGSQPWAQLGFIRAHRPSFERLLLEKTDVIGDHKLGAAEPTPNGTILTFKNGLKFLSPLQLVVMDSHLTEPWLPTQIPKDCL